MHQSAVMHRRAPTNGADDERDPSLAHAARRLFGSYRALIEAAVARAGDASLRDAALHPTRGEYPTVEAVVEGIRARVRAGGSMLVADVTRDDGPLVRSAKRFCGGWHKAIRAAGLDPREVGAGVECHRGRRPRYPDAFSVLAEIRRRAHEDLPLNANAVQRGPDRDLSLLVAARLWFTQWEGALRAAGIDPASVRPR
ncbi:MAG TPA: hypothetical protein VHB21_28670 [Minicystis sp.]|nr:hypothetical protein [Minicystis sp.]